MPTYSQSSKLNLDQCHLDLQRVFNKVIVTADCTIITGHRGRAEQERMVELGRSKVNYPDSKHNVSPSLAVDAAPYLPGIGIPWPQPGEPDYVKRMMQFTYFAGYVLATAHDLGITLRWGGDWDRDHSLMDQSFDDLVHFELVNHNHH